MTARKPRLTSRKPSIDLRRGPRERSIRNKQLTIRQQMFVREYAADPKFNATEAARKCGYSNPAKEAGKLLSNPLVQRELSKVLHKRAEKVGINAERVLRELSYIGCLDPGAMFNDEGQVMPIKDMPQHVRRAIKAVKVRQRTNQDGEIETRIDVELHPKIAALELIAKHLGMLNDKLRVEHGLTDDFLSKLLSHAETTPTEVIDGNYLEARLALPATSNAVPNPLPTAPPVAKPVDSTTENSPSTNDTLPAARGGKNKSRSKKGKVSSHPATDDSLTFDVEAE
jgi:phage terminase small subunit